MVNNCSISDKDKIIELGLLLNENFNRVNNVDELINNKEILGYYDNNELLGIVIFKKVYEVIDLLYIVVDPKYRNKGIGKKLVDGLKEIKCEKIMLEVNEKNNSAISLYKKCGFKIINVRKKYYGEYNAYVMELVL